MKFTKEASMTDESYNKIRDDTRGEIENLETEGIILMGQKYLSEDECLRLQEIGDRLDEAKRKSLWEIS